MKKLFQLFIQHVEKIILAIFMLALIGILWWQKGKIETTRKLIDNVKKVEVGTGQPKNIADIEKSQFDLKADVEEVWLPAYTYGGWEQYAQEHSKTKAGEIIFKGHKRTPPKELGGEHREEYMEFIDQMGPGSLFDPQLYVFPRDGKEYILGFETKKALEPPHKPDYVTDEDPEPGKKPKIDEPDGKEDDDFLDMLRFLKVRRPYLNFVLNTVQAPDPNDPTSWTFTFRVRVDGKIRTVNVKLNERIEGTDYQVISAKREERTVTDGGIEIKRIVYTATCAHFDDGNQRVEVEKGKPIPDPSKEPYYELVFYPRGRDLIRVQEGTEFTLSHNGKSKTFMLQVTNAQPEVVEVRNGNPVGDPTVLKTFNLSDFNAWESKNTEPEPKRAPGPGAEGEFGPGGGMPMPPN